jgi:uncharacterized integral membrane protein
MNQAKLIAALVVLVIVAVVFLQNRQPVEFTFLFFTPVPVSKTLLIFASAVFGSLATLLIQFLLRRRNRQSVPPASPPHPAPPVQI